MPAVGMVTKVLFSRQVLEPLLLTIPTIVQTARNVYDDYRKRSTKSSAPVPLEELERRVSEQALLTSELAARLEDTARALRLSPTARSSLSGSPLPRWFWRPQDSP